VRVYGDRAVWMADKDNLRRLWRKWLAGEDTVVAEMVITYGVV
jgi:hypothetical protein